MPTVLRKKLTALAAAILALLLFASCGGVSDDGSGGGGLGDLLGGGGAPEFADPEFVRSPPAVAMPEYVGGYQQVRDDGDRSGIVDMTNANQGYVSVIANSATKAVLQVTNTAAGTQYNYMLKGGGVTEYVPLAMGDGYYTFLLLYQMEGASYEEYLWAESQVALDTEQAPFLLPSVIVDYTPSSEVVSLSYELGEHASTDLELVQQVYYWVENNISYDYDKARQLANASEYAPDPDATIRDKTGICYDFAAVVAAMLRANAIPCKLIMGNVNTPDGGTIYHAWNMIWLEDTGWIVQDVPTTPGQWQRIDLTSVVTAGEGAEEFVGDGSNYVETSQH